MWVLSHKGSVLDSCGLLGKVMMASVTEPTLWNYPEVSLAFVLLKLRLFVRQQGQCKDRTGTAVLSVRWGCWEDFLGSFYSEDPWMAKPSLESPVKSGFILGNYRGFCSYFIGVF